MPRIAYVEKRFRGSSLDMIWQANQIIDEYRRQGFDLTLRQLYYQFVSRDLLANKQSEYKRLGAVISDARLAGEIDWTAIVDRTRNVRGGGGWDSPDQMVRHYGRTYGIDRWENQPIRPEVWVEKDALIGVIARACAPLNVPYFSCRGYTSQSEMWAAAQRHLEHIRGGQSTIIIHLGDHDPSGIDMTRDIQERMHLFLGWDGLKAHPVQRIALNEDQIQQYGPPPNPAKLTDSRATAYIARFGYESWELDALEPTVLADLITGTIEDLRDEDAWAESAARLEEEREILTALTERWDDVRAFLENGHV